MLLDRVKATIKKYNLVAKNDKILIAVSGGPDSVTLLYLLNSLKKEFNLSLHVAHLDHMLRKDSAGDAEFVKRLAQNLKIPITLTQVNVEKLALKGSLEEIARNARLGFLFNTARGIKADKIALGHSLDDQAETVLMRILRGTGLYGLSAILPKRNIAGFWIIRPLIETSRKDIEAFLRRKKIKSCLDASNLKDIYLRNKIRHQLLPLLERQYNKNIKKILSNMAESAGLDYDYIYSRAIAIMKNFDRKVNLKRFLKLHPAIQRLAIRQNIARLKGDTRRLNFKHIREIEDLILNRPVNSIVDLPKGVSVVKKKGHLLFFRSK
ncbi:MAG: tRNA lysidine(34) synthetase TilS [Candidatus Omnitrophica bacterium]|nr:tRNA lysidine(34) synthetase TilS [Candidatus Omnitrophota bacterium]